MHDCSEGTMNLSRWIRRIPVPHSLMCGDKRVLIGEGHRRWADAVDAVFATDSDTVVAMGKDGTIIRTCQRADIDDAPQTQQDDGGVTDQQKALAQIAQILADAYSTAHEHARENSARGYELLAKFAELSFQRLAAIEKAYGQLLAAHAAQMQAETGDAADSAIGAMMTKAMGLPTPGNGAEKKT